MKQLLTIVALEDHVFSHALNVSVSGTSRANHSRNHQNGLVWHNARDCIELSHSQACLFCVASTSLQRVDAPSKVSLCQVNELVDDAL